MLGEYLHVFCMQSLVLARAAHEVFLGTGETVFFFFQVMAVLVSFGSLIKLLTFMSASS